MENKKRKTGVYRIVLVLAWMLLCLAAGCGRQEESVFTMDGAAVSPEEYLQIMKREKFYVERYFADGFQAEISEEGFWETEYQGEVPLNRLLDQTMEQLRLMRAMYGLAEERGYVRDGSYAGMKERMEQENALRAKKKEAGEVVYGLSSFSLDQWMDYEGGILEETFCNDLKNPEMNITEEEKKEFFEAGLAAGIWVDLDGNPGVTMEEQGAGLDQEIRKSRYQELLRQRADDISVVMDEAAVYRFMLEHL